MGVRAAWPSRPAGAEAAALPSPQGWVFNVVPWLVAIPASLFGGFLSDYLIRQGEPGAGEVLGPGRLRLSLGGRETPVPGVQLRGWEEASAREEQAASGTPGPSEPAQRRPSLSVPSEGGAGVQRGIHGPR